MIGGNEYIAAINFLNNLGAVFNEIYPAINALAGAFADDEQKSVSNSNVEINIQRLDDTVHTTTVTMAHLIRVVGV